MPLHILKLSVGSKTLEDLGRWQAHQTATRPPLRHTTRNFPRRAEEILAGGSIYWVVDRILTARQRVMDIVEARRDDGARCTELILDTTLIPVQGRLVKPFQGWRYLEANEAPADIETGSGSADLPETLRRELAALALI